MERSNPNDGSDDRSDDRSDEPSAGYPVAPLPAHERQWRHPSEMGQQAWVLSEPPMALGKGLLVTTGAIGCAIGLAILWMLFPVGGSGPIAEPVVTRSINTLPSRRTGAGAAAPTSTPSGSSALIGSSSSAPSGSFGATLTLPAEDVVPSNTVMLHATEPVENAAIAVLIGDSSLMITTANAVGNDTELSVMLDSGDTGMATVVSISDSLAYLQPSDAAAGPDLVTVGFATSAEALPGDVLHVLAPEPVSFTYEGDNQLGGVLGVGVVEGTPIVNDDGALVALCSHDDQGIVFLPVPASPADSSTSVDGSAPDDTATDSSATVPDSSTDDSDPTTSPGTGTTTPAAQGEAWLGLRLAPTSDGLPGVAIQSVMAGSPAQIAGFEIGQRLLAIDDVSVRSAADVAAILQGHRPGDVIVVTVSAAAGTSSTTLPTAAPTTSTAASSSAVSTVASPNAPPPTAPPTSAATPATTSVTTKPTMPPATIAATTSSTTPTATSAPSAPGATSSTTIAGTSASTGTPVLRLTVVLGEREPSV